MNGSLVLMDGVMLCMNGRAGIPAAALSQVLICESAPRAHTPLVGLKRPSIGD
jgi:hypothetical protein